MVYIFKNTNTSISKKKKEMTVYLNTDAGSVIEALVLGFNSVAYFQML